MADIKNYPVSEGFNIHNLIAEMSMIYRNNGYTINTFQNGPIISLDIRKDNEDIKKYLGLSTGFRADFSLNNNILQVIIDDQDWAIKIIVALLGLFTSFMCISLILLVTGCVGIYNQYDLNKKFLNNIQFFLSPPPAQNPNYNNPDFQNNNNNNVKHCPSCNFPINTNYSFCSNCGNRVN